MRPVEIKIAENTDREDILGFISYSYENISLIEMLGIIYSLYLRLLPKIFNKAKAEYY